MYPGCAGDPRARPSNLRRPLDVDWHSMAAVVQPTVTNRIATLDVIRGVAILGILIANITAFGWPEMSALSSGERFSVGPYDGLIDSFRHWLVSGKMRGMLSLLFGVGMYLQASKRKSQGLAWPGSYIRRMAVLLAIGAFHGIFIWYGDILFMYAALGLAFFWLANVSDRVLGQLAVLAISVSVLMGFGLDFVTARGLGDGGGSLHGDEMKVFSSANYLDQLAHRAGVWVTMLVEIPFGGLHLAGMFALGVLLGRRGILAEPSRHKTAIRLLLVVGLCGLGLNFLPVLLHVSGSSFSMDYAIEMGLAAPLALGYAAAIAVVAEKGLFRPLTETLGMVGRTALSCYLLTSLICVSVFYGWGLGWFGKLDMPRLLAVVAVVWVVVAAFAMVWTRKFQFGPVEWLWRSWTLGQRLPILKPAGPGAVEAPPVALVQPPVLTRSEGIAPADFDLRNRD